MDQADSHHKDLALAGSGVCRTRLRPLDGNEPVGRIPGIGSYAIRGEVAIVVIDPDLASGLRR